MKLFQKQILIFQEIKFLIQIFLLIFQNLLIKK